MFVTTDQDIVDMHLYGDWSINQLSAFTSKSEAEIQAILDQGIEKEKAQDSVRQAEAATLVASMMS